LDTTCYGYPRWTISLKGNNMSMSHYEKAKQIISQHFRSTFFSGPKSPSVISSAQERLNVIFPPSYARFLSDYGAGGIGSFEIYGLTSEHFDARALPDVVWYIEKARKEWQFPQHLIPISELGNGEIFCLDTDAIRSKDGEVPVITYMIGFSLHEEEVQAIAEDFGVFFLSLVEGEQKRTNLS
jgi:antitoxin YobK